MVAHCSPRLKVVRFAEARKRLALECLRSSRELVERDAAPFRARLEQHVSRDDLTGPRIDRVPDATCCASWHVGAERRVANMHVQVKREICVARHMRNDILQSRRRGSAAVGGQPPTCAGAQGREVRPSAGQHWGSNNLPPGQGATLKARAAVSCMCRFHVRGNFRYRKEHGLGLASTRPRFRGLNCRAWAALADHRKNKRPTSEWYREVFPCQMKSA